MKDERLERNNGIMTGVIGGILMVVWPLAGIALIGGRLIGQAIVASQSDKDNDDEELEPEYEYKEPRMIVEPKNSRGNYDNRFDDFSREISRRESEYEEDDD